MSTKHMRITKQVRVGLRWHEFAKEYSREYGVPISKVMDLALKYFSGERKREQEKNNLEYEQKMAILFPNRKMKSGHNVSKTQSVAEMSTMIRKIRKDMRSGDFWTSTDYLPDNDNETKV